MNRRESFLQSRSFRQVRALLVGLAVGVFLHYLLFRLTLPVQPFIYVSF